MSEDNPIEHKLDLIKEGHDKIIETTHQEQINKQTKKATRKRSSGVFSVENCCKQCIFHISVTRFEQQSLEKECGLILEKH